MKPPDYSNGAGNGKTDSLSILAKSKAHISKVYGLFF